MTLKTRKIDKLSMSVKTWKGQRICTGNAVTESPMRRTCRPGYEFFKQVRFIAEAKRRSDWWWWPREYKSDDLECRQWDDWQRRIRTRLAKWIRKLVPEMRRCIAKWSIGDFKDEHVGRSPPSSPHAFLPLSDARRWKCENGKCRTGKCAGKLK